MEIGSRLGTYEIGPLLGVGGMGEVYRARDTKLGREVAIKVLPESVAQDEDRLARFGREARVLASLNHPNIATLHSLENDGATHFLVMELVEGETLAERILRNLLDSLPTGRFIQTVSDSCSPPCRVWRLTDPARASFWCRTSWLNSNGWFLETDEDSPAATSSPGN